MPSRRFMRLSTGEELVVLARADYDALIARARRIPAKDDQILLIADEIAEAMIRELARPKKMGVRPGIGWPLGSGAR